MSTDGSGIAVVKEANIYFLRSPGMKLERITSTGVVGSVYHGVPDWIYKGNNNYIIDYFTSHEYIAERILRTEKCLWFSPNGEYLAFLTVNSSQVDMTMIFENKSIYLSRLTKCMCLI